MCGLVTYAHVVRSMFVFLGTLLFQHREVARNLEDIHVLWQADSYILQRRIDFQVVTAIHYFCYDGCIVK